MKEKTFSFIDQTRQLDSHSFLPWKALLSPPAQRKSNFLLQSEDPVMVTQWQDVCEVMPVSDPHPEVDGKVGFAGGLEGGGKEGTALIADKKLDGL